MGVHGLTTYLAEHHNAISQRLQFSSESNSEEPAIFVVDGWSFIYECLATSGLPWVYGGEYAPFARIAEDVVRAWLSVGLKIHLVFDGPYPAIKFPTIISRITQTAIQGSLLFFRTSAASRSRPRFLKETAMIPPLSYLTCIQALTRLVQSVAVSTTAQQPGACTDALQLHFADEEGDPFSVELAARIGGYVVGNDSDFAILNADGYKGYIPMQEMVWNTLATDDEISNAIESDGEFQTVVKSKSRKKGPRYNGEVQGVIPPVSDNGLQLSVTVYSPTRLAAHLELPVSLLPLMGALVGNDFTGGNVASVTTSQRTNLQWLFFERHLTNSQRITRVAFTLRSILDAALSSPGKSKQKIQVSSVMQLIERAVTTLTVRSADMLSSGERERVVERIVEATLQYAIPKGEGASGTASFWASPLCALHQEDACSLVRYLSKPVADSDSDAEPQDTVRNLYISAYRTGSLDPRILDVMHTGTFWHRQFLENPDHESIGRSIARPIHEVMYALLDDVFGVPQPEDEEPSDDEDSNSDDELVDVVEESDDEDPLAPLRGALQQLDDSVDHVMTEAMSVTSSVVHSPPEKRRIVVEYLRRGTRVAAEEVVIPTVNDIFSRLGYSRSAKIQTRSEDDRFTFFLRALRSDTASIRSLPRSQVLITLAIRWTVSTLDFRARDSNGSRERVKERWTKLEARAFLAAFTATLDVAGVDTSPPILDRNVQLGVQTFNAFTAIIRLLQVLLLQEYIPLPTVDFSGQLLHAFLTNAAPIPTSAVSAALWNACVDGLDEAFAQSEKKKRKMGPATSPSAPWADLPRANGRPAGGKIGKGAMKNGAGMFDLLASMDA